MNIKNLRRNKVRVAVGVLILLAVMGGAYLLLSTPTEISNAEELQQVREDLDGHYVLVDDINLSHIDNFEPIGGFMGTFDGNGHTISGLTIDRPEMDSVGLFRTVNEDTEYFGLVDNNGVIEDISLHNVNITGGENVGGLVGINRGNVNISYTEGDVSGSRRVGGLVGANWNEVSGSCAEVSVTGDELVGGLVGINDGFSPTVAKSYATGDVAGGDPWTTGSLAGANADEIRSSYAVGDVVGGGGGLVGTNVGNVHSSYATGNVTGDGGSLVVSNDGEIKESYATGRVTSKNLGGLVKESDGDVTNSYWDTNSTGQKSSAIGTQLTTSEMTGSAAREKMEGFDFGGTWRITEDDYPRLAWQDELKNSETEAEE